MASLSNTKLHNFAVLSTLLISMFAVSFVTCYQFPVGGDIGWVRPSGNENETYNGWATRNRFHVGDSLYFKYQEDSILVVNSTAYNDCIVSNPIAEFDDGNTTVQLDRSGFFYFISGQTGHCNAGQRLIVRVMVHPATAGESPNSAPSPAANGSKGNDTDGGDDYWDGFNWGQPSLNSTTKFSIASVFMTALAGVLVILYLLT